MLKKCLEAIEVNLSHRSDYEIVVIDNNSTDGTFCFLDEIGHVRFYKEENQGLSYARNRLIRESRGEYLVFLDDDAIIINDLLCEYSKAINEFPDNYIFGGKVVSESNVEIPSWFDHNFHMAYSILNLGNDSFCFKKPYGPIGANFLVKKNSIGYIQFRTDLGRKGDVLLSGEETDFIVKLGGSEEAVYVGSAVVHHHFGRDRYSIPWALERFRQNGLSDYIMRKEQKKLFRGLLSQIYHFVVSIKTMNSVYIKSRYASLSLYVLSAFR